MDFILCVDSPVLDVSTSFKRLQAEKLAADAVLRDVSPLEGIKDADALRDFFKEIQVKDKVCQQIHTTPQHIYVNIYHTLQHRCSKMRSSALTRSLNVGLSLF